MYFKWNQKIVLLLAAIIAVSAFTVTAQQYVWSPNTDSLSNIPKDKAVSRQSFPREFKLFNLNIEPLREQLFSITGSGRLEHSTVISLPNANGNIEQFEVFEASNFEPELQARFPEIRAFSGRGITDKYATLKLSISPQGIQTMVFRTPVDLFETGTETEFVEPYSQDRTVYAVFKTNHEKGELPWACSTLDKDLMFGLNTEVLKTYEPESSAGQVKTMRLAQSCNGEYSNFLVLPAPARFHWSWRHLTER